MAEEDADEKAARAPPVNHPAARPTALRAGEPRARRKEDEERTQSMLIVARKARESVDDVNARTDTRTRCFVVVGCGEEGRGLVMRPVLLLLWLGGLLWAVCVCVCACVVCKCGEGSISFI